MMEIDRKHLESYLRRQVARLQETVATVPVRSRRYGDAVDDLEEAEELLGIVAAEKKKR
jgi:hypothetical protein